MAVLMESPWYRQIVEESEKRGEKRGLQQSERQSLHSAIEMGLELKFGEEGLALMPEIRQIEDIEMLRRLRNALKDVRSLPEFRDLYQT